MASFSMLCLGRVSTTRPVLFNQGGAEEHLDVLCRDIVQQNGEQVAGHLPGGCMLEVRDDFLDAAKVLQALLLQD